MARDSVTARACSTVYVSCVPIITEKAIYMLRPRLHGHTGEVQLARRPPPALQPVGHGPDPRRPERTVCPSLAGSQILISIWTVTGFREKGSGITLLSPKDTRSQSNQHTKEKRSEGCLHSSSPVPTVDPVLVTIRRF